MKKYLFKQTKKAFSLFLAVVMLMSCWVWMAPEKAEAAAADGQYYVKITALVKNWSKNGSGTLYLSYIPNNGTGTSTGLKKIKDLAKGFANESQSGKTITLYEGYIDGFPDAAKIDFQTNASVIDWSKLRLENFQVFVGKDKNSCTTAATNANSAETSKNTSPSNKSASIPVSRTADLPTITAADTTWAGTSITCPAIGTTEPVWTPTEVTSLFKDQYGVRWIAACTPTVVVSHDADGSSVINKGVKVVTNGNKHKIEMNATFQEDYENCGPEKDKDTRDIYLVAYIPDTEAKLSQKITVYYNKLSYTFYPDGSVPNMNSAVKDKAGNTIKKDANKAIVLSDYYGRALTGAPTNTSVEAGKGYTFLGFWSKPQPSSGAAYYYSKEADFAYPATSDEFKNFATIEGETEVRLDKDKKRRYDAGVAWNPDTETFTGNAIYYGWWISKDINVKFYDVDGAYIGEQNVKYGQTQSDIKFEAGEDGKFRKWNLSKGWPVSNYTDFTSGAFTYKVVAGQWVNTDGTPVDANSHTFTEDLILTPVLAFKNFDKTYEVYFINPSKDGTLTGSSNNVDYRADISGSAETAEAEAKKTENTPNELKYDKQYSYEFVGWSSVPTYAGEEGEIVLAKKNYHVILEEGDFDVLGKAIGVNTDWVIRADADYYAVYRRHIKSYVVRFTFNDATATSTSKDVVFKYGDIIEPPVDDVPYTYTKEGYAYNFENWSYSNDNGEATIDYANRYDVRLTKENVSLSDDALDSTAEDKRNPIIFSGSHKKGEATDNVITFTYKVKVGDKYEDYKETADVKYESFILEGTVGKLNPAETWDDGAYLNTFMNLWEITEGGGALVKDEVRTPLVKGNTVSTADLVYFTPTSNVDFKAVYGDSKAFYTVTYIDGDNKYSERVLVESNVPAWKIDGEDYIPETYEGQGGEYVFEAWVDSNGKAYTTSDKVIADLVLNPKFRFEPDTFTITFVDEFVKEDGTVESTVLRTDKFELGDSLEKITNQAFADATAAAQERAEADPKYNYTFLGWDKAVPSFCQGEDMTFKTRYKSYYDYYNVNWFNSAAILNNDGTITNPGANKDFTLDEAGNKVYTNLFATTKHTYNSKLYTPSVSEYNCLAAAAPEGQNYVFAAWYYDVDGVPTKYERGMKITAEMEFYAVYKLTEKVYTITTFVKGVETTYESDEAIPDPKGGYNAPVYEGETLVKESNHDEFIGWYATEKCECTGEKCECTEVSLTDVTENITVYARFAEADHEYVTETKKEATYYEAGLKESSCSCDPEKTFKSEVIPMLVDSTDPTGIIYLGTKGSWKSDGKAAYETEAEDGFTPEHVNADTDIVITANDTGMGVKLIRAFIYPSETPLTAGNFGAAQQVAVDVYEAPYEMVDGEKVYTQEYTYNANFAVNLGDFLVAKFDENGVVTENGKVVYEELKNGETYAVYYYVIDKAGNQLDTKVRTAKFIYDNEAPVFTVTGHKNGSAIPTYCSTATITGIEDGATLKVNNEVVEVKDGEYVINYAEGMDNVLVAATDKAGNTYSKKIKLVAEHNYHREEVLSTCYTDGYCKEYCLNCGYKNVDEKYTSTGHVMGMASVVSATCTANGYEIRECENCDYTEKNVYVVDEYGNLTDEYLYPALGHKYEMDGENEKWTVVTVATCKTEGLAERYCTVCGDGKEVKNLGIDADNHEAQETIHQDADCITPGYDIVRCSGCYKEYSNVTIEAKGHKEGDWEIAYHEVNEESVLWEATCYQPGKMWKKCTVCSAITTEATEFGYTEEADGEYAYVTEKIGEGEEAVDVKVKEEIDGKTYYKYYHLPATGKHVRYVISSQIPDVGVPGYIKWGCKTEGCPYVYEDNDHPALEGLKVVFVEEDGKTVIETFENYVSGEMIGTADITAPTKEEDKVNRYTFAGWVEVITNDDGKTTEGSVVKLPLTVTKNMTLKATYRATKKLYEHVFMIPTDYVNTLSETDGYTFSGSKEYITLIGTYGDVLKPGSEPVFKASDSAITKKFTFKFDGWFKSDDETKTLLTTDEAFKVVGDATFKAVFTAVPVTYDVIYYNGSDYVWKTTVNGGAAAVFGGKTPEKASDDAYHYEFDKWYVDASLKTAYNGEEITAKTQLYAGFKATAHTYEGEGKVIQEATCTLPVLTEYTCACGHKKTETGATDKHTPVTVEETRIDGIYEVVKCSVCGTETSATKISYSVVFKNSNGVTLQTSNLRKDDDIKYEKAEPTLADSEDKSYKFIGWYVEGDESKTIVTPGKATCDVVYIAAYEATVKTFRLTFVDKDNNTITTTAGLEYGYTLKAGDFPADLEDYKTQNDHCTFIGWSASVGDVLKADLIVKPVFDIEAHKWEKSDDYAEPDCEQGGGIVWVCTECGATETRDSVATGHKWIEKEGSRVEPNLETGTDGYYINVCTVCGKESEKIVIPAAEKRDIVITVKDSNGNAILGALVELYQDGKRIEGADTNANGKVTFEAYEGKYKVLVSGVADAENVTLEITLGEKGYKADVIMEIIEEVCGCSCHRDGFWGIIFRFFQKIIKFFTGSIRCCSCPDERY